MKCIAGAKVQHFSETSGYYKSLFANACIENQPVAREKAPFYPQKIPKLLHRGQSWVKKLGSSAFAQCKNLEDVYCYAETIPETGYGVFNDSYIEYTTLHVPESAIEAYRSASPWNEFGQIVAIEGTGIKAVDGGLSGSPAYYSLGGRKVDASYHGLVISRGRKTLRQR